MGVPNSWMVYCMENLKSKWMITGGYPYFRNIYIYTIIIIYRNAAAVKASVCIMKIYVHIYLGKL